MYGRVYGLYWYELNSNQTLRTTCICEINLSLGKCLYILNLPTLSRPQSGWQRRAGVGGGPPVAGGDLHLHLQRTAVDDVGSGWAAGSQ